MLGLLCGLNILGSKGIDMPLLYGRLSGRFFSALFVSLVADSCSTDVSPVRVTSFVLLVGSVSVLQLFLCHPSIRSEINEWVATNDLEEKFVATLNDMLQ